MIKTVSIETAKKLKEAGFKQESSFYYDYETMQLRHGFMSYTDNQGIMHWSISAPTTDELLEELPYRTNYKNQWGYLSIDKTSTNDYIVGYRMEFHKTLLIKNLGYFPEALAAMWLWLNQQGLIPQPKDGKNV